MEGHGLHSDKGGRSEHANIDFGNSPRHKIARLFEICHGQLLRGIWVVAAPWPHAPWHISSLIKHIVTEWAWLFYCSVVVLLFQSQWVPIHPTSAYCFYLFSSANIFLLTHTQGICIHISPLYISEIVLAVPWDHRCSWFILRKVFPKTKCALFL